MKLELENTVKRYGATTIVPPLNLTINEGEFIVLLGPSGCGKSTILRMIAGLEEVTSGKIKINGQVVNGLQPKDRDLAMVFQSYALYPHMTVRENMSFSLKMRSFSKDEIKDRVDNAARFLHLEEHLNKLPSALSGGQRQRVAMGRVLVRRPKIFLFDEPLSNLDAKLRLELRGEIKRLHQKASATTIYVTHDQEEAMSLADRIIILRAGVIEQEGSPIEIFNRPRNTFIAEFLGSPKINFIEKDISPKESIQIGHLQIPIKDSSNRHVKVGIRPGDISFYPKKDWILGGDFEVDRVELLGDSTLVHGSIEKQPITMLTNTKQVPNHGTHPCYINPGNIGIFHADTGNLLN